MKVFIYEFVTGGGVFHVGELPSHSLLREGWAMIAALAEDFGQLDGIQVFTQRDERLSLPPLTGCQVFPVQSQKEDIDTFTRLSAASDWTVLIAPEFDDLLLQRCQIVESHGGRLLSPSSEIVRWASNKEETAQRWQEIGVPTPRACRVSQCESPPDDFPFPAVLKPVDGAGSVGMCRVGTRAEFDSIDVASVPIRLEVYVPGTAASVSYLSGPSSVVTLPPCYQYLSQDGSFTYLEGETINDPQLSLRALRLADQAVIAARGAVGYLGIDLVLGPREDGSTDFAIELNPRLTTSYIGLRKALRNNLAAVMLALAEGQSVELSARQHVRFSPT